MKNILVPLSSSLNNKQTLQYAVDFAAQVGCDVYVTSLFKIARAKNLPKDVSVPAIAKQQLDSCIQSVDKKNVSVESLPLEGDDIQESIELLHQKLHIDLIILAPQGLSVNETLYLGEHAGAVVKRTQIPVLIVPRGYEYKPIKRILMALKSGVVKRTQKLKVLEIIKDKLQAEIRLFLVKTATFKDEDAAINPVLHSLVNSEKTTENSTIFQAVLEHLNENEPDLLCVFKRKQGFFEKLWDDNTVKKIDFESRIPLLVLKGAD
ncbi:universal stress protein [Spongiivirga citrea]|uniref:Universal stress protein n=1 Tax=Spongiivirga citrea TaxID=1481457 RepID=A0A6M0CMW7_9FLAO|nr:universal stress protein [Spongiivirga citrea]NER17199.1 universal stress protein [Spongiivirga citrea]